MFTEVSSRAGLTARRRVLLPARVRRVRARAGDQLPDHRGPYTVRGGHDDPCAGPQARDPGAVLRAVRGAAGGRGRLPLHGRRARGDRASSEPCCSPSSTCSASCCCRSSRAEELERRGKQLTTRTRQLATLQVGHAVGAAAHARPAGPHDRAALRGGRPLRARDRDRSRLLEGGAGAGPHRRAPPRPRQVHLPRPDPEGGQQAHRRGLEHHQDAPVSGRAGGGPDGGLRADQRDHPGPSRADRRQGLSARA